MALLVLIVATVALGLLVVIGVGVRHILQDVGFMADIVERNIADAEAGNHEVEQSSAREDSADDQNTKPMGFGVRLRERS